jgi:hypothetical protein
MGTVGTYCTYVVEGVCGLGWEKEGECGGGKNLKNCIAYTYRTVCRPAHATTKCI